MTEGRFTLSRKAADVTSPVTKNNVYQWPGTGTYTLQPINFTTDFSETSHWEAAKFRLADVDCNADWWKEAPDNTNPEKGGPSDYFFHGVVKATNYVPGKNVFHNLVGVLGNTAVNAINFEQSNTGVGVMKSKAEQPANQAYYLRFRVDGRATARRAAILDFYFGQFMLRLNTYGEAQLWQTIDHTSFTYVYSWRWANTDQIHGRSHSISIVPHCRNRVEFIASTGNKDVFAMGHWHIQLKGKGLTGHGIYEIPGPVVFLADGKTPQITTPSPWFLAVSREYRPMFQISRLVYANGTNPNAFFWDNIQDIMSRTGVVYPPTVPLFPSAEYDANGGRVLWALRNSDTGQPFVSDGASSKAQFGFAMAGIGNVAGPGLGSTITPEFYGYAIDKPPAFFTYERSPYICPVHSVKLDHGDCPEAERLATTIYDMGAYERFSERGDIPLELGDLDSGLLFFEGTAHKVEAGEAPAQTPVGIHLEAHGMIDNMLRMEWPEASPDFSRDPYDAEHRPYLMGEVIRTCFEASGEPRGNVVIEEEERYLKNFRLWSPGEAVHQAPGGEGEPASENKQIGAGHKSGASKSSRWQPVGGHPVHEFTDHFIRSILGWNWVRDRSDRKWHIYKRPDPNVSVEKWKFVPKVEFYSDHNPVMGWNGQELPAYKHSDLKKELKRPRCTTIICVAALDASGLVDRAALNAALSAGGDIAVDAPNDSQFQTSTKVTYQTLSNPRGYVNPMNPNPDLKNPDFLGRQRIKVAVVDKAESADGLAWMGRRLFEDNCFGFLYRKFEADWGDEFTYNLRKWDMVLVNGVQHYIDRIEPSWDDRKFRRAHYTVVKYRPETRAPR